MLSYSRVFGLCLCLLSGLIVAGCREPVVEEATAAAVMPSPGSTSITETPTTPAMVTTQLLPSPSATVTRPPLSPVTVRLRPVPLPPIPLTSATHPLAEQCAATGYTYHLAERREFRRSPVQTSLETVEPPLVEAIEVDGLWQIILTDSETGESQLLQSDLRQVEELTINESRQTVTFWWRDNQEVEGLSSFYNDGRLLYTLDLSQLGYEQPVTARHFWSLDGETVVALVHYPDHAPPHLALMAYRDGRPAVILRQNLANLGDPFWSPDSQLVAFTQLRQPAEQFPIELDMLNLEGETVWQFFPYELNPERFGQNTLVWLSCETGDILDSARDMSVQLNFFACGYKTVDNHLEIGTVPETHDYLETLRLAVTHHSLAAELDAVPEGDVLLLLGGDFYPESDGTSGTLFVDMVMQFTLPYAPNTPLTAVYTDPNHLFQFNHPQDWGSAGGSSYFVHEDGFTVVSYWFYNTPDWLLSFARQNTCRRPSLSYSDPTEIIVRLAVIEPMSADTWLERRREAINQCDSALVQLVETLTIESWTVTRLLLDRCPEAEQAEYLLPLDDERVLIFSTGVENEALLARLIATVTIP